MDSNRVRFAVAQEPSLGVAPSPMRFKQMRITKDALSYVPKFFVSNEIRADRMSVDPSKINEENTGSIDFEMHYPVDGSPGSYLLQSVMLNPWVNTLTADNNLTAGSVTSITAPSNVVVANGGTYTVGMLVVHSGFANAANNGVFPVTTGGTNTYTCLGAPFVTEASAPATARSKVVGVQGVAADIAATATGLTSTTLVFNATGIGMGPGTWIKIGGSGTTNRFATAANNDWVRVVSSGAHTLTLDHLPAGWAADIGTTKTIRIFTGDRIRNGTTFQSLEIVRTFTDHVPNTFILQKGMQVDQLDLNYTTEAAIVGTATFMGMSGGISTTDPTTAQDAATTTPIMTANVSVGAIYEGFAPVVSPNWIRSLTLKIANNIRMITAVGNVGAVTLGMGEVAGTGTLETYFGNAALASKLFAGTISDIIVRSSSPNNAGQNQAFTVTLPRVTFTDGNANAAAKNQDVVLPLSFVTSIDSALTAVEVQFDRHEYWEL